MAERASDGAGRSWEPDGRALEPAERALEPDRPAEGPGDGERKCHMGSGTLSLTIFFDISYLVGFAAMGKRPCGGYSKTCS